MTTPLPPQDPREPDETFPGETELAALYRQLPQGEPGPRLDAAVLRAAAQALAAGEESPTVLRERRKAERERGDWVHPKPVVSPPTALPSAGGGRRPRWLIALGSAASLVLAAGLAWHMREPSPATLAPAATDSTAPAQAALQSATAPAAAMPPTEAAAPPPAEPAKQAPPKQVAAQSAPEPAADTSRKTVADASAERASSKAKPTGSLRRAAAARVAAPTAALQEVSSNAIEAAPEAPAMMAAPAPAPSVGATTAGTSDTPARELDEIQQLFKQGRDDEARERLTAFQHAHPQWDLPPELRAQLRKP